MNRYLILFLFSFFPAKAQNDLKTPEEYFGYDYGMKFHFHSQIVEYTKYIAQSNPEETKFFSLGRTYEGREQIVLAFGTRENIANLEEIRKTNLRNIGLLEGEGNVHIPNIAMLSFNVHGNESVNTETSVYMMYALAGGDKEFSEKILKNTVVLIDPCVNPDGFDRYVQWYNRMVSKNPNANPEAMEHREPWPGGRPNHYLYDLNRDLAWQVQKESQQRMAFYNSWMPHYHGDFHEMGPNSSNFFAPSAKPFHEDLTEFQRSFQNRIGEYHKKEFDQKGWLYYTKSAFDLLYPSYGDTYPSYNGAVAMTYEQAGSGVAGLAYKRTDGDTLTLGERISHVFSTGKAALEAVSNHGGEIKENFNKFFNDPQKNGYGIYKSFVLKGELSNITALTQMLDRLHIKYSFAQQDSKQTGFSYKTQKNEAFTLEKSDLIVSTYQPKGVFAKILFEPHTMLEDSNTYDITAWSLAYAYGLNAFGVSTKLSGSQEKPTNEITEKVTGNAYAYALKPVGFEEYKFLAAALQSGIRAKVQPSAFKANGKDFPAGTVVFPRQNDRQLDNKLNQLLQKHQVHLEIMTTGMVESGMDLGLDGVYNLGTPRIGILSGNGIASTGVGDVWHYFDWQLDYPVTLLDNENFSGFDLNNYDVLIFPSGRYDNKITESKALETWINKGGRIILLERANASFAGKDGFALKHKTVAEKESPEPVKYADAGRSRISQMVPGAIYEINLDNTHPLAFGYPETMNLLIKSANNYELLSNGWNVGTLGQHKSGFVGNKVKATMKDVPVFAVQDKGRGKVIYLTESPIFRGFWHTGKALFANAVFMVK